MDHQNRRRQCRAFAGRSLAHIPPDGQSIKAKSINPIFMFISQQCRSIHLTRANSPPHPIKIVFVLIVGVKCRFQLINSAQLMLLSTRSSHESIVRRKPKDKCRPELNENHANQYDDDKSAPWHRVLPDSRDQGNDRRDDCRSVCERQHDSRLSAPGPIDGKPEHRLGRSKCRSRSDIETGVESDVIMGRGAEGKRYRKARSRLKEKQPVRTSEEMQTSRTLYTAFSNEFMLHTKLMEQDRIHSDCQVKLLS